MKSVAWFLAVLVFGSLGWLGGSRQSSNIDEPMVETVRVGRESLRRTVIATGVIRPVVGAEINVGSRLSGIVRNLPVRVGDVVVKGDLLAELDPTALAATIDRARAELALAEAELVVATDEVARSRELFAKGVISQVEVTLAERDLAVTEARIRRERAALRAARIDLGYTRITAPIGGVIAAVSTREGETVAAALSAPTFVTIVDTARLEVLAYVDETDIGRVFVGQKATFTVDTYPDHEIGATVASIDPKAVIQSGVVNYVVRLTLDDVEDAVLRPEMTAHVRLVLGAREQVLAVPRRTIRHRDGSTYVLVRRNGTWQQQAVRIGWRTDRVAEILEGLSEGEMVQVNVR